MRLPAPPSFIRIGLMSFRHRGKLGDARGMVENRKIVCSKGDIRDKCVTGNSINEKVSKRDYASDFPL